MEQKEIKPGWQKQKRDSLLSPGVTEVAYRCGSWAVVADHTGVEIRGESPKFTKENGGSLEDFAWILSDAMREYMKLKRCRLVLPQ